MFNRGNTVYYVVKKLAVWGNISFYKYYVLIAYLNANKGAQLYMYVCQFVHLKFSAAFY